MQVGAFGMRMKASTISVAQSRSFFVQLNVPVLGWLRDTQNYIDLAAPGPTLRDVAPSRVERDLELRQPIVHCLHG